MIALARGRGDDTAPFPASCFPSSRSAGFRWFANDRSFLLCRLESSQDSWDDYATEGMDLEEVGLAHTMENLLYTISQKCEAALGEHPTDAASFERWSNLDMIDRLWWMLRAEKTKVRSLGCISICDILKFRSSRPLRWGR